MFRIYCQSTKILQQSRSELCFFFLSCDSPESHVTSSGRGYRNVIFHQLEQVWSVDVGSQALCINTDVLNVCNADVFFCLFFL